MNCLSQIRTNQYIIGHVRTKNKINCNKNKVEFQKKIYSI